MGGLSGYIISCSATASQISSLQRWTPFFTIETPQAVGLGPLEQPACRLGHALQPSGVDPKNLTKRANFNALLQMPRHHCKADDTHVEWVSCLGKSHVDAALGLSTLIASFMSCLSVHTRSFVSESDSAPRHRLRATWSRSVWVKMNWMTALDASDAEELSGSVTDPALLPPSASRNARLRADEELIRVMTRAVNELGLEWSAPEEPSRSRLDKCFFPGRHQALRQRSPPSSLKYTTSSRNRDAPPTRLAEEKGHKHLPPLDESVAAHLCPPTAIGWKARASHPSKPCRAPSALAGHIYSAAGQAACALHSMVVLQVFQAKMLANEEAGLDTASLRDLRSATDLALRATKVTAQAIGRTMSSLIVLERHLWLTMMEMKEADKVPFLNAPVSLGSLFGPAVEGFAERFTEA